MPRPIHAVGFPMTGDWVAVNTPAERIPSHGTDFFGQRFAYDFARLNTSGSGFSRRTGFRHFIYYVPAADFFAWDESIFSAFSGTVLAAKDGWPDRLRVNAIWELIRATFLQREPEASDLRSLLGNYLLIQGELGVALYAHVRQGSIVVQRGQVVRAGERLASVGNSGNSTMPHLHFHVMDRADPWQAQGVYCGFRGAVPGAEPFVPSLMTLFRAQPLFTGDA